MREAWRQARSVDVQWRALYNLPPTDPRYLEATEAVMIADLLARKYMVRGVEVEAEPPLREVERWTVDPEVGEALVAETLAWAADPKLDAVLAKLRGETSQRERGKIRLKRGDG